MAPSFNQQTSSEQAENDGDLFLSLLEQGTRAGRPTWPTGVPGLLVPRLLKVLARNSGPRRTPCLVRLHRPDPASVINPATLAAIEIDSESVRATAFQRPGAQTDSRRLGFAALHDLDDWPQAEIADEAGYTERAIRQYVKEGRERWRDLGAWPWTYLALTELPAKEKRRWRRDAYVMAGLRAWAESRPVAWADQDEGASKVA